MLSFFFVQVDKLFKDFDVMLFLFVADQEVVLNFRPVTHCWINVGYLDTFLDVFGALLEHNFVPVKGLISVSNDEQNVCVVVHALDVVWIDLQDFFINFFGSCKLLFLVETKR